MESPTRKLKIYRSCNGAGQSQPRLILQGLWLSELHFDIGDFVTVECMDGRLIISKAEGSKIAVIGSRGIKGIDLTPYIPADCTLIISGGAQGVDTLAEHYAAEHGIKTLIIRPEYEKYGRSAPIRRNDIIVDNANMVLAFWDGKSRGTKYTIDYAKKHCKPIMVIEIKEETI